MRNGYEQGQGGHLGWRSEADFAREKCKLGYTDTAPAPPRAAAHAPSCTNVSLAADLVNLARAAARSRPRSSTLSDREGDGENPATTAAFPLGASRRPGLDIAL